MSTPSTKDATQQQSSADSLEQKVKAVMATSKFDVETGKVTLPEDIKNTVDADTLYAVTLEHRRRNTQASYTTNQQKNKALEAENSKLTEILSGATHVEIPKEDQERLGELMYEDPVAWRKEMDAIEKKSIGEHRAKIAELTGEAKDAAGQSFELDRRQQVLKDFNDSAKVTITEELIANEVPPRITNKLAKGEISFEDFLQEVATYVGKDKVVGNETTLDQPNMNNLGGKDIPDNLKPEKGLAENYKNDVY